MSSKMWFGTEDRMQWIDTPLSGADFGAKGWKADGELLNGGGFAFSSFGKHKTYNFAWSNASSRQAALTMQAYKDGSFGRGLIYFVDPTAYDTNLLPAHWADPSMAFGDEAPALIRSQYIRIGTSVTSGGETNALPIRSASYDLSSVSAGYPGERDSLFLPVPPGFTLIVGAIYQSTGSGGVFIAPMGAGSVGAATRLSEVSANASLLHPDVAIAGSSGVRLWIGKSADGAASVTLAAMSARLVPTLALQAIPPLAPSPGLSPSGGTPPSDGRTVLPREAYGPWLPGEGHTGVRFRDWPTYVKYNGVGGGQVGYGASFREVGAWAY